MKLLHRRFWDEHYRCGPIAPTVRNYPQPPGWMRHYIYFDEGGSETSRDVQLRIYVGERRSDLPHYLGRAYVTIDRRHRRCQSRQCWHDKSVAIGKRDGGMENNE